MSGRRNFRELRERVVADPERRKRVEELGRAYDAVLALADLREARGVTQAELAGALGVSQPNISKLEGKGDIRLSTLGGYVAALGGRLEVRAVFPDHPEHDQPHREQHDDADERHHEVLHHQSQSLHAGRKPVLDRRVEEHNRHRRQTKVRPVRNLAAAFEQEGK